MINRIYVDNFRCLVNFEARLERMSLLMGANGSGKSTVFHVANQIRAFLSDGLTTTQAFPTRSLTRWQTNPVQTFELDVPYEGSTFQYNLTVEHDADRNRSRVARELLTYSGLTLFEYADGVVHLHRDNGNAGPQFSWDWTRSALGTVAPGPDNKRLTWFREWWKRFNCVQIDAMNISGRSEDEAELPGRGFTNFASWYRGRWQEKPENVHPLYQSLSNVIPGFDSLPLMSYGDGVKMLVMRQSIEGKRKPVDYHLDELSDGQRALICLYSLVHLSLEDGASLWLDEIDNFVALREIQPLLNLIEERCSETQSQTILISHHPSIIDKLAPANSLLLTRQDNGPTKCSPFISNENMPLSASAVVARGWEGE